MKHWGLLQNASFRLLDNITGIIYAKEPMIENVEGIVLRIDDANEYDKRLTLYTREYGKLRAKMTGVRKSGSKLKSLTIPFVELRLQIFLAGNKRAGLNLPGKVVSGEMIQDYPEIRSDWNRMVQTSQACEILDVLTHPFYSNPKEYDLIINTLKEMESSSYPQLVRARFTLFLLKILGYSFSHHPLWKSMRGEDQSLFKVLAEWDAESSVFSMEQINWIDRIVRRYLSNYLTAPLKTEIFQQKLATAF